MSLLERARCVVAMMEKVPAAGNALLPEVRDLFTEIEGLRSWLAAHPGQGGASGSAALRLAEQVLSMDMATQKGRYARELARIVISQADDMLTTLRLIEHATAPTHEDGAYHEAAFELSHACIERTTPHMPQALATPPAPAPREQPKNKCALCWEQARFGSVCDACHDSMGTAPPASQKEQP